MRVPRLNPMFAGIMALALAAGAQARDLFVAQGHPNTVLFEENLIVNCEAPMPLKGYGYALQVRYNIFADNGGGLWFGGTTFGARVVGTPSGTTRATASPAPSCWA